MSTTKPKQFEICRQTARIVTVEVKGGSVEAINQASETGAAARVISDWRPGFAYSTKPLTSEDELLSMAEISAKNAEVDKTLCFPAGEKSDSKTSHAAISKFKLEEKVDIAKRLESKIIGFDKRIKGVRKPVYEETLKDIHLVNSNGADIKFSKGLCLICATAIADNGRDSEWTSEIEYSLDPATLDIDGVAKAVAGRAVSYLDSRKIPSQHAPCLLCGDVATEMLGLLAGSFFADALFSGKTQLAGKIGQKIYSDKITIVDDATLKGGFASVPFDSEGAETKRTVLVNGGTMMGFLSDATYAKKTGMPHTSSSTRGTITQPPRIGPHNLHITAGKLDVPALLKTMHKGLYVTDVLGLHTANPITGDFSVGASGFLVENGAIKHGVKGITIAGNFHQLFQRITAVGSDLKFRGSTGSPSLLVEEIAISGD